MVNGFFLSYVQEINLCLTKNFQSYEKNFLFLYKLNTERKNLYIVFDSS